MAHVPGAQIVEISRRGFVRAVMDDVMHDAIPPIAEHHADGEAVRDIESGAQPCRQQNGEAQDRHADPGRRADESQWRRMMLAMHGRKIGHAMQSDPVQDILREGPENQSRQGGTEPFRDVCPGDMVDIDRRQRDEHQRIDDEVRVIAQFTELHRVAPRARDLNAPFDHDSAEC